MKKIIILIVLVLGVAGWVGWKWFGGSDNGFVFMTVKVQKGNIVQNVSATGIVQPIKLVQAGTQVNGLIVKLYVDFNSKVKEGDLIAQIDPALYEAEVAQRKANLIRSEADVDRVKANLNFSTKELERTKELAKQELISESELDSAIASLQSLDAQLKISKASVAQSKSLLELAEVNLEYTTIRSPVDGVIISRNVDEGQTVVSSLQAQTLFTIATDLKKVKVEASIPEADIGKIKKGNPVTFTVDAYPEQEFYGLISQVRLSATIEQNVVTYAVIIHADNPNEKLFPGMTANLICEVAKEKNTLKIMNSALRFKPAQELIAPGSNLDKEFKGDNSKGGSSLGDRPSSMSNRPGGSNNQHGSGGHPTEMPRKGVDKKGSSKLAKIWVQTDDKLLKSIIITIGISDGSYTQILKGDVKENQEVVTAAIKESNAKEMVNPFGRRRRR